MKTAFWPTVEIITILVALVFGLLWMLNPSGSYEPIIVMCGLIGAVVVHFTRKKTAPNTNAPVRLEAEARYVIEMDKFTIEDIWDVLTRPFLNRYESWHPSFNDLEPIARGVDGKPLEFEVRGSRGGRYPWRIEEWNETDRTLRLWIGPSKNPPDGDVGGFLGFNLGFRALSGVDSLFIDITYKERWTEKPWRTNDEWFKKGPQREIKWIFDRFPLPGKIDYIRELDQTV